MFRSQIDRFIDEHTEEMLEDLKALVRIDSKKGEALPGMPYGEGPARALAEAESLMKKYGLITTNYDNYVVTGDFSGAGKQLDILAHLDVVPVSPDWTVTEPFNPVVKDGRIYGRGTADDKGPAIAAIYAVRAIKELGIELKKNVRLILGADEECGSSDLAYYYAREEEAPMSFTPDADFPLINIEKGRLEKKFTAVLEEEDALPRVTEFCGGDKVNVVPASARASVIGLTAEEVRAAADKMDNQIRYEVTGEENIVRILAKGTAAHASTPDAGNSAVCGLLELLCALPLADTKSTRLFRDVLRLFPRTDYSGQALGISMEDEISGILTMNLGILNYDGHTLSGVFDSRVPICGTDDNVTDVIEEKFREAGIVPDEKRLIPPHHVPADSELVQGLLASYERYSGIKGEPQAIGGGTYVHELKRGVAFGCMVPEVDNHMHGDDEFMEIDMLVMSAKIFADAILRFCS